ncbi:MAG: phage terminase small subunit-related protein [Candidatus Dadabacteria bacterium]|nr:phage terminase small subunit-related protein [Candidatus Dadabacteria bacterium]
MGRKPPYYFDQAERLYVVELCTLKEIASRLNLAKRTLINWKRRGNWEEKRIRYIESKKKFHEELEELAKKLIRSIMSYVDSGKKIDVGRIHAIKYILSEITKINQYEEIRTEPERESIEKVLSGDTIRSIIRQVYGTEL